MRRDSLSKCQLDLVKNLYQTNDDLLMRHLNQTVVRKKKPVTMKSRQSLCFNVKI
jgi:hypothetical protein